MEVSGPLGTQVSENRGSGETQQFAQDYALVSVEYNLSSNLTPVKPVSNLFKLLYKLSPTHLYKEAAFKYNHKTDNQRS